MEKSLEKFIEKLESKKSKEQYKSVIQEFTDTESYILNKNKIQELLNSNLKKVTKNKKLSYIKSFYKYFNENDNVSYLEIIIKSLNNKSYENFLLKYLNVKTRQDYKKVIDEFVSDNKLNESYQNYLNTTKNSSSTISKKISYLIEYFRYFGKDDIVKQLQNDREKITFEKKDENIVNSFNKIPKLTFKQMINKFNKYDFDRDNDRDGFLLLGSYLYYITPRSDIINIKFKRNDGDFNYIDIEKREIVFNKTLKREYPQVFKIPDILYEEIKKRFENGDEYLFKDRNLNKILKNITEKVFGEVILSTVLRKMRESYYSEKVDSFDKKNELAKKNGHTLKTATEFYINKLEKRKK